MSFTVKIKCDLCGSNNTALIGTTDNSVLIKCNECGQLQEADDQSQDLTT